jgi:D-psicose/D-tagatose/L-ribulose 3-epimerase
MHLTYSITLSSFLSIEDIYVTLEKLADVGFDQLEMFGEPDEIDLKLMSDIILSFNFKIIGITGMWGKISPMGWKRRILSNDISFRKYSENYVIKCIEMCNYFGGDKINVCLFADPLDWFDSNHGFIAHNDKKNKLSKSFSMLTDLANRSKEYGINLLIEPLNRYSTPFCSNLEDSLFIVEHCENLGIMLDTFHMNIEEDSFKNSIIMSKSFLHHLHFADNNRKMPGFGHIDFDSIISALKEISYSETISYEPTISNIEYKKDLIFGKNYIEKIESKYD